MGFGRSILRLSQWKVEQSSRLVVSNKDTVVGVRHHSGPEDRLEQLEGDRTMKSKRNWIYLGVVVALVAAAIGADEAKKPKGVFAGLKVGQSLSVKDEGSARAVVIRSADFDVEAVVDVRGGCHDARQTVGVAFRDCSCDRSFVGVARGRFGHHSISPQFGAR